MATFIASVPSIEGFLLLLIIILIPVALVIDIKTRQKKGEVRGADSCPLCGKMKDMHKAKLLYGQAVCKKCYYAFANRRQLAFAIDIVLWNVFFYYIVFLIGGSWTREGLWGLWYLFLPAFFMKDAFAGHSPGKAICGVQVINEITDKPIGLGSSFKRNLTLLIPFVPLIVAFQLCKGHRLGDDWANSKVIWKKYASHPIFLPKPPPESVLKAEKAPKEFSKATKLEISGKFEEAIKMYEHIIETYPDTETSADARISLDNLKKIMEG